MVRKALLIGIADYSKSPDLSDLRGPINDVENLASTLLLVNFRIEDITILTNRRATKTNIIDNLKSLLNNVQTGDFLMFYYAGHGSRVPLFNDQNELDGKDEVLCPCDTDFYNKHYIRDDDLNLLFSNLPSGVTLEVIADSCYSGTVTREGNARYTPPPLDLDFYLRYQPKLPKKSTPFGRIINMSNINHILWSACNDQQLAKETEEYPYEGVFTRSFCKIIRSNPNITRRELDRLVTIEVENQTVYQTPQVELQSNILLDKPIFT